MLSQFYVACYVIVKQFYVACYVIVKQFYVAGWSPPWVEQLSAGWRIKLQSGT